MAQVINANISSGLLKFTFTDADGDVFAYFKMNPADINLAARCSEVAEYFEKRSNEVSNNTTVQEMAQYSEELKEKLDYLLGYKASETLFDGLMSPVTLLPNGELFAFVVLDKIASAVEPEIKKRKQKMQKAMSKYTDKYSK